MISFPCQKGINRMDIGIVIVHIIFNTTIIP